MSAAAPPIPISSRGGLPAVSRPLVEPAGLGDSLRRLHELRVLEQLIPGITHARGLLQFNAYHRYTVDEHSIRVVEHLTLFADDRGTPGEVYRSIKDKATLHLARCCTTWARLCPGPQRRGARLAQQIAATWPCRSTKARSCGSWSTSTLRMSHLAQQHDISDDNVVVPFAVEVGSPEILKMLYVLTLADLAAVGPGVLNEWKQELLTDLYQHAVHCWPATRRRTRPASACEHRREEFLALAHKHDGLGWWETQVIALPPASCLFAGPPSRDRRGARTPSARCPPRRSGLGPACPSRNAVEYTVGTYEEIAPGIFHKLTGALTSKRQRFSRPTSTRSPKAWCSTASTSTTDIQGPAAAGAVDEVSAACSSSLKDAIGSSPSFASRGSSARRHNGCHPAPADARHDR